MYFWSDNDLFCNQKMSCLLLLLHFISTGNTNFPESRKEKLLADRLKGTVFLLLRLRADVIQRPVVLRHAATILLLSFACW